MPCRSRRRSDRGGELPPTHRAPSHPLGKFYGSFASGAKDSVFADRRESRETVPHRDTENTESSSSDFSLRVSLCPLCLCGEMFLVLTTAVPPFPRDRPPHRNRASPRSNP